MENSHQKQLLMAGGFVVLVIGITVFLALFSAGKTVGGFASSKTSPIVASDHIRGNASSSVTIIEYGDFECPACGAYEQIMQQLTKKYGDRVGFIFRQFPLYQIHPNARISAQASEAAALQGKFWEMHDVLYSKQTEWSDIATTDIVKKNFDLYARSIGIDVDQFNTDIISSSTIAHVENQRKEGDNSQVNHTPTFFLNLNQIQNPTSVEAFSELINAALADHK